MVETKREKFLRLGTYRVNKVLDGYRLLANLKSSIYESTPAMRQELIQALRNGLEELELHYAGEKLNKANFVFRSGQVNGHNLGSELDTSGPYTAEDGDRDERLRTTD